MRSVAPQLARLVVEVLIVPVVDEVKESPSTDTQLPHIITFTVYCQVTS